MTKIVSRMMMAAAASAMAFTPIAAQAGTRASQDAPVYSGSKTGNDGEGEGELFGVDSIIIGIAALVAVGFGIFFAIDSEDVGQSPGT
jgi:hypothetical protein